MIDSGETQAVDVERYLQFNLGKETYAVHLLQVREVIPKPETTSIPNSPGHFVGIMNLRGLIISVYDLRKKLGVPIADSENCEEAVVIVNIEETSIGLIVDAINKVVNVETNAVVKVPEIKSQINAKYIEGVHRDKERLTMILNLSRVFDLAEVKRLASMGGR